MPRISVVVPNYNHARFLRKRIDSILAQTLQDFELILLDDCSTDESRPILSSYASDPRVRTEFNETNSGSTFKQWNKGVRLARGEYVWIAESDDYAGERLLERLVDVLDADPTVAFAYCQSWRVSADDNPEGFADPHLRQIDDRRWTEDFVADGHEECRNYFVRVNPIPNASAVVFRRALYERVGGADESLRLCGDWKLWAAVALTGKVAYLAEPLNYYRSHTATVHSSTAQMNVDILEYFAVINWVLSQVEPPRHVGEKIGQPMANMWVPAVMSLRVPLRVKLPILKAVRKLDPHPFRNAIRPALLTFHRKLLRHWHSLYPRSNASTPANRPDD